MKIQGLKITKLIAFVFAVLVIFSLFSGSVGGAYASASVNGEYSNVLDDLQKDESFDISAYPAIDNDYSLQVFQIAESTAGELFIYVYQPSANVKQLTATEINMSLSENVDGTALYSLDLLNYDGALAKYLVNGVTVSEKKVRYYNISSIYRLWDNAIDGEASGDNTGHSKSFEVGKLFSACTINDNVNYECEKIDVLDVRLPYTSLIRYADGVSGIFYYIEDYTDSHYVAFDANYKIDELYAVQLSFYSQQIITEIFSGSAAFVHKIGEPEPHDIVITDKDSGFTTPSGWLIYDKLSFSRIQKASDFLKDNDSYLDTDVKELLKSRQWVLRFYETDYQVGSGNYHSKITSVSIEQVALLRLHFKSNGVVYNLGAVSDIVTGSGDPSGVFKKSLWEMFIDLCKWLESLTGVSYIMWAIIFFAVPICIIFGILSIFFPPIRAGLKVVFRGIAYGIYYLAYGIWFIISLPFKGIARFIEWIRDKKDGG